MQLILKVIEDFVIFICIVCIIFFGWANYTGNRDYLTYYEVVDKNKNNYKEMLREVDLYKFCAMDSEEYGYLLKNQNKDKDTHKEYSIKEANSLYLYRIKLFKKYMKNEFPLLKYKFNKYIQSSSNVSPTITEQIYGTAYITDERKYDFIIQYKVPNYFYKINDNNVMKLVGWCDNYGKIQTDLDIMYLLEKQYYDDINSICKKYSSYENVELSCKGYPKNVITNEAKDLYFKRAGLPIYVNIKLKEITESSIDELLSIKEKILNKYPTALIIVNDYQMYKYPIKLWRKVLMNNNYKMKCKCTDKKICKKHIKDKMYTNAWIMTNGIICNNCYQDIKSFVFCPYCGIKVKL